MALGELGCHCMKVQVDQRMLNFWARLVTGKSSKISVILYKVIKEMNNNASHNSEWLQYITKTLNHIGMVYLKQQDACLINPNALKVEVKMRTKDIACQNWHESLNDSKW